ncbi:hypothetical protein [Chlamydia caviae]|uniref:hypothetical protein n=1 Tax=Chlamydia caviae TaxID=83557 RepID=UPI001930DEB2|nr:hypothetical protein [Chlamydia caviae]
MWSYRCIHEASLYGQNSFLTLTYEDRNLPEKGSLVRRDVRLFLMRFCSSRARFSLRCARPMPVYSVSGLIDHF